MADKRLRNFLADDCASLRDQLAEKDRRIEELDHECQLSMQAIADERARAEAAEARIAALEEGLKPFKAVIDRIESWSPDAEDAQLIGPSAAIYIGDLRRARSVLGEG